MVDAKIHTYACTNMVAHVSPVQLFHGVNLWVVPSKHLQGTVRMHLPKAQVFWSMQKFCNHLIAAHHHSTILHSMLMNDLNHTTSELDCSCSFAWMTCAAAQTAWPLEPQQVSGRMHASLWIAAHCCAAAESRFTHIMCRQQQAVRRSIH
jgi:hypothetical protein